MMLEIQDGRAKPPKYLPTPGQIQSLCALIQLEWTPRERWRRERGVDLRGDGGDSTEPDETLTVPVVTCHFGDV